MSEDLQAIDERLSALERVVAQAYRASHEETLASATPFIQLPLEAKSRFRSEIKPLKEALFSSGKPGTLRLVSELHDAIRIRIIYVEQLLSHDVPRPYVDEALRDYAAIRPGAPAARPAAAPPPQVVSSDGGLLAALLNLLAALFGRRQPAARGRRAAAGPVATGPAAPAQGGARPFAAGHHEEELRLIYLHKLMEEDRQHLLTRTQRPPRVEDGVTVPAYIANFSARDFAESHFAVRPKPSKEPKEPIARTPEELRAKLSKRSPPGKS